MIFAKFDEVIWFILKENDWNLLKYKLLLNQRNSDNVYGREA